MNNQAAWIKQAKAQLEVGTAPDPVPAANEVVIRNKYVAVNPGDSKMQDLNIFIKKYPFIFGQDIAGEVSAIGSDVTRFDIGQRVIAVSNALLTQDPRNGAYQHYTVVPENFVVPVPSFMPLEEAVVLPLSIATSAAGLFQKAHLGLPYPSSTAPARDETIVVWGASSAVGSSAVQLAVAAGYKVVATASIKNRDYVKQLGAELVFDHSSPSVIDEMVKALQPRKVIGAFDAISFPTTLTTVATIMQRLGGGTVVVVLAPRAVNLPEGVKVCHVSTLGVFSQEPEAAKAVFEDFLPQALEEGKILAKPDPLLLKGGLAKIQEGITTVKQGMSAQKLVVEL